MRSRVSAGIVLASILAVITLTGCYSAPIMPPTGMLYNDTAAPMNMGGAEMGSKSGEATATSFFGLVSMGDCSVKAAAEAGGITNVKHTDYHFSNILGYQRFTTIVYGD